MNAGSTRAQQDETAVQSCIRILTGVPTKCGRLLTSRFWEVRSTLIICA